jgi:hypothetical protein
MLASEFVLRRAEIEAGSGRPRLPGQHQPRDPEAGSAHPVGESSTPPSARVMARSEEHLI